MGVDCQDVESWYYASCVLALTMKIRLFWCSGRVVPIELTMPNFFNIRMVIHFSLVSCVSLSWASYPGLATCYHCWASLSVDINGVDYCVCRRCWSKGLFLVWGHAVCGIWSVTLCRSCLMYNSFWAVIEGPCVWFFVCLGALSLPLVLALNISPSDHGWSTLTK